MSSPVQTCQVCGDREWVMPDGRGFPPDIAKRRLAKRCKAAGHNCDPLYTAGWVTDPAIGISRNDQLRIVGNGVCPQQAIVALRYLLSVNRVSA